MNEVDLVVQVSIGEIQTTRAYKNWDIIKACVIKIDCLNFNQDAVLKVHSVFDLPIRREILCHLFKR